MFLNLFLIFMFYQFSLPVLTDNVKCTDQNELSLGEKQWSSAISKFKVLAWIVTSLGRHHYEIKVNYEAIQKSAPYWEGIAVIEGEFKTLRLTDFQGKYLVLMFYPLDFTFVCPTEILAFNDRLSEFLELNAEVVVCSVDSHYTHLAWTNTSRKDGGLGPIKIPMLSDLTRKISQSYGVYLPELGHTLRGLFIIDGHGTLRQITINDLPVGRSVDETLRLLQAFQYTDAHGEVCPANWKPGAETIIPHPIKKRSYFEKINEDCSGH